jgi:hypothetical protein
MAELKIEELTEMVADTVLDKFEYKGKTIREWVQEIIEADHVGKWISVSEKMPEEHEWIGTKRFGTTMSNEVYVTFENPKGDRFTKHLSFQNGKLSLADQQRINALYKGSVPVAWMPLPEPYKAGSEGRNDT